MMIDIPFNPFRKQLDDLKVVDLVALKDVSEGWYVEYKRQANNAKHVAKSISSFSNQYGGWLFFGIDESKDKTRKAGSFPGIAISDIPAMEEYLKNAAKDCVHPTPYFRHKVLLGPCCEIGLLAERAVIVTEVVRGANPPYIHADGRIYRRVADSSSPKFETDKSILDQLWGRGQLARDRLKTFISQKSFFLEEEVNLSILKLSIMSDPFLESDQKYTKGFERFAQIMAQSSLPLDNIFAMTDGYIGRQVKDNDHFRHTLTWKFYDNCSTVFDFLFSSAEVSSVSWLGGGFLDGYKEERRFLENLDRLNVTRGRILDLNYLFWILILVIWRHRSLVGEVGITGPFYIKAYLENIRSCIPFIDTSAFVDFVEARGVPIIQDNEALAPPGTSLESCVIVPLREAPESDVPKDDSDMIDAYRDAFNVLKHILHALGIPFNVLKLSTSQLVNLASLAGQVQENRKRT